MAALEKGRTSYTDNRGTLALREEISRYVARHYGPEYNPEDEILVTVGVSEALDAGHRVEPVPGACALVAAVAAGGLPSDEFHFGGFLPRKSGARARRLGELAAAGGGDH